MKYLLCIHKGTGSKEDLIDPEVGVIYKAEGPVVDKTCVFKNEKSNLWYKLPDLSYRSKFSSLLFEELPDNFIENVSKTEIKIPKALPKVTELIN
jgi:hypothetical protein